MRRSKANGSRISPLILFVAILQGCIPVYLPVHQELVLKTPLNLSDARLAPDSAKRVSVLRQGSEAGHEITGQSSLHTPLEALGTQKATPLPMILAAHVSYVGSEDPAIWVADSFAQALKTPGI